MKQNINLMKIHEKMVLDHHNDPRAYIEYSNHMPDVSKKKLLLQS